RNGGHASAIARPSDRTRGCFAHPTSYNCRENERAPVHESIAGPFFILVMRNLWYAPVLISSPPQHLAFALAVSQLRSNCRRHNLRLAAALDLSLRRDLVSRWRRGQWF